MKTKTNLKRDRRRYLLGCVLLLILVGLASMGCSGPYGTLRPDDEVDRIFTTSQILPDHKYYYSGSEARPAAIIAIKDEYQLKSDFWKPVTPTKKQLDIWNHTLTRGRGYTFRNYGGALFDPQGDQIGVWYSRWDQTTVKMVGPKTVMVYPPLKGGLDEPRFFQDHKF